jgi:RNA polymerase sigma factor (sigma-70 family)
VMKRFSPQNLEDPRAEFSLAFSRNFTDICRFVANRSDAVDVEAIVSEAFLVAWKRWPNKPERDDELRPWLFGIARNVMRSSERHERVRSRLGAPENARQDWSNEGLDGVESDLVLRTALAAISSDDREIILLVAWEDLDTSGLAIALGVSKTAARVRLHRARKRLAAEVARSEVAKSTLHKYEITFPLAVSDATSCVPPLNPSASTRASTRASTNTSTGASPSCITPERTSL